MKSLVRAVYSGGGRLPIYKKLGCQYGPADWWPIVGDRMKDTAYEPVYPDIVDLHDAIQIGLSCADTQKDNDLYVTDMVDWTRTYLAHIYNWAVIDVFKALERGDIERLKSSSTVARRCLTGIENIMATRPDFHLQPQIDRYMKIPGVNPYTPWYMKQHCVNDLYSANDVYEQMHWFYRPRVEVYLNECENRARQGIKTIEWSDIEGRCNDIRTRWLDEDISVPADQAFQGTPLEAVEAAFKSMEDVVSRAQAGTGRSVDSGIYSPRESGNVKN